MLASLIIRFELGHLAEVAEVHDLLSTLRLGLGFGVGLFDFTTRTCTRNSFGFSLRRTPTSWPFRGDTHRDVFADVFLGFHTCATAC